MRSAQVLAFSVTVKTRYKPSRCATFRRLRRSAPRARFLWVEPAKAQLLRWQWRNICSDSRDGNPYLRYRMPESGLSRAFPQYTIAEMPGDHHHTFEDANVAALGKILSAHMRQAEQA